MSGEDYCQYVAEACNALCFLGEWEAMDSMLRNTDAEVGPLDMAIAKLTFTNCVRFHLPEYRMLYDRLRAHLLVADPERVNALLSGLEP